ncbi:MAG: pseudouridine synthase [Planctomycetota bacterium]|nr:pseudouridine synthase [Planctomycetota bacterium]
MPYRDDQRPRRNAPRGFSRGDDSAGRFNSGGSSGGGRSRGFPRNSANFPSDGGRRDFREQQAPNFSSQSEAQPSGEPTVQRHAQTSIGMGVRIVFEDRDLLVVDKPPGLLTVPVPGRDEPSVFGVVKDYVRSRAKRRGTRAWIIHRLDRAASGLLVFAKTEPAFEALKFEFRTKKAHRIYYAVVEGGFAPAGAGEVGPASSAQDSRTAPPSLGTIQSMMREIRPGLMESVPFSGRVSAASDRDTQGSPDDIASSAGTPTTARDHPDAGAPPRAGRSREDDGGSDEIDRTPRRAVTHYRVVASGRGRSLLRIRLETGLKNQIRVHMRDIARPIVGDALYGSAPGGDASERERLLLHATELSFMHPATGAPARFRSRPPALFWHILGVKPPEDAPEDQAVATGAESSTGPINPAKNAADKVPGKPGWDHVAGWYEDLLASEGSDHQTQVIWPGTLRLLAPLMGERLVDVACGEGTLTRQIAESGAEVLGVDIAPRLIEAARSRGSTDVRRAAGGLQGSLPQASFFVGDARDLTPLDAELRPGHVDAVSCVMALMNIDPLDEAIREAARILKPGGRFVGVILHPAFRALGQTSWGWENPRRSMTDARVSVSARPQQGEQPAAPRQYRRVDAYLSQWQKDVVMNPGEVAHGKPAITTVTHHRPISAYVASLARAGLMIDALEEWTSKRTSQPGPRAAEEDRARGEIPMFLAFRAIKRRP